MATTKILGKEIYALSSSYAVSASYAPGGGASTPTFPYTGSAIISGSLTVTGSLNVSGGITGSLQGTASYATNALSSSYAVTASYVTGSIFTNSNSAASASYAQTASYATYAANGGVTKIIAGANINLSPVNGLGDVTVTSLGTNLYNTATGSYGSFYDTGSVAATSATTVYSMSLSTTDISNGVFVSASSGDRTRVKFTNAGVYNLQFSSQFSNTDNTNQDIVIWVRKNGSDIVDSSGVATVPPFKAGSNGQIIAGWNYYLSLSAGDFIQMCWHVEQANVITLETIPAGVGPTHPRTPSTILTATRVDTFLSNTGSFSGSFTGTLTGTASYATNALSASYAPSTPAFPYTGSAGITGSLTVVGPTTSTQIGAGAAPSGSVPLDVRSQGALSTDTALRVRNSANTLDIIKAQGDNEVNVRYNLSLGLYAAGATRKLYMVRDAETYGIDIDWTGASTIGARIVNNGSGNNTALLLSSYNGTTNYALSISNGDISLSATPGTKIGISNTQKLGLWNATPIVQPTASTAIDTLLTNTGLRAAGGNANFATPITSSIILNGTSSAPSLNTTAQVTTIVGSNTIYSIPTASYDGAWFEYTARSASNARAGQIMSIWSGSLVNFTETTTTDFGSTTGIAFTVIVSGSNLVLTGSCATAGWTIKTIVRSI
jgi:hypothetical protein